jgi:hypothetical protein
MFDRGYHYQGQILSFHLHNLATQWLNQVADIGVSVEPSGVGLGASYHSSTRRQEHLAKFFFVMESQSKGLLRLSFFHGIENIILFTAFLFVGTGYRTVPSRN